MSEQIEEIEEIKEPTPEEIFNETISKAVEEFEGLSNWHKGAELRKIASKLIHKPKPEGA